MLHGRRLDHALEHVSGSRYALVHAVAKRARQITLWLTADPAELRADAAPPPVGGETITRDPVALAETEILDGEVIVRWDPDGTSDEADVLGVEFETDPLLIEGLDVDDDDDLDLDLEADTLTPALAQVLDTDDEPAVVETDDDADADDAVADPEDLVDADDVVEVPLDDIDEDDDDEDGDED